MPSKPTVVSLGAALSEHEAVCAQRLLDILRRIGRLEAVLLGGTGVLICGMASLIIRGIN